MTADRPESPTAESPETAPFSAGDPMDAANVSLRLSPVSEGAARALVHAGRVHSGMTYNQVLRAVASSGDLTRAGVVKTTTRICFYLGIDPQKG